jgi:hypothetical protein
MRNCVCVCVCVCVQKIFHSSATQASLPSICMSHPADAYCTFIYCIQSRGCHSSRFLKTECKGKSLTPWPKRTEVSCEWMILRKEDLGALCSLPSIVRIVTSRLGSVAHTEERWKWEMHTECFRKHHGKLQLGRPRKKELNHVSCKSERWMNGLVQDGVQWRSLI